MVHQSLEHTQPDPGDEALWDDAWSLVQVWSPSSTAPRTWPLAGDTVVVYRRRGGQQGDIVLDDGAVSNDAISMWRTPAATWIITDRGALNPLRVNGSVVTEAELAPGDVVRIGRTVLVVECVAGLPAPARPDELRDALCAYASAAARRVRLDAESVPEHGTFTLPCPGTSEARAVVHWLASQMNRECALVDARDPGAAFAVDQAQAGHIVVVDRLIDADAHSRADVVLAIERRAVSHADALTAVLVPLERPAGGALSWEPMLTVPRLRHRRADVVPAMSRLLDRAGVDPLSVITPDLAELLTLYDWPGETDELRQAARRAVVLSRRVGVVQPGALIADLASAGPRLERQPGRHGMSLESVVRALKQFDGNMSRISEHFGCSRQHFYRQLKRAGIDISHARELALRRSDRP